MQLIRIFATYAIYLGLASGLWNARLIDGSQFAWLLIFPAFIQCLARIVPLQKPAVLVMKGLIVLAAIGYLALVVGMPTLGMALITGLLFALKLISRAETFRDLERADSTISPPSDKQLGI